MHLGPSLARHYLLEMDKIHKASVSCRIEVFLESEWPWQAVLMDEGFLAGPPSSGVSVCSHRRHKVNFHSWICDLMPGCSESCVEWRSEGLIG